jgi:hypothetical protein
VRDVPAEWLCKYFVSSVVVVVRLSQNWIWSWKHEFGIHGFLALVFSGDGYFYNVIQTIVNTSWEWESCKIVWNWILFYFENRITALWEILNCLPFGLAMEVMRVPSTLGKGHGVMWEFKSRKRWWWGGGDVVVLLESWELDGNTLRT